MTNDLWKKSMPFSISLLMVRSVTGYWQTRQDESGFLFSPASVDPRYMAAESLPFGFIQLSIQICSLHHWTGWSQDRMMRAVDV